MDSFLGKFFPDVIDGRKSAKVDAYCKYDNQWLTAFTSSLWIAGALSSLVASRVTRRVGRQAIMLIGGVLFLAGSIINAAAVNIAMLIIGRMLLGFGLGFTLQAAPVYLSETAPARWRGAFTSAYIQRLRRRRHTVGDRHQLLHQPHPRLGVARLPGPGGRAGRRHRPE
jgi:MFS family permease